LKHSNDIRGEVFLSLLDSLETVYGVARENEVGASVRELGYHKRPPASALLVEWRNDSLERDMKARTLPICGTKRNLNLGGYSAHENVSQDNRFPTRYSN
jgi:hypothetical protein